MLRHGIVFVNSVQVFKPSISFFASLTKEITSMMCSYQGDHRVLYTWSEKKKVPYYLNLSISWN